MFEFLIKYIPLLPLYSHWTKELHQKFTVNQLYFNRCIDQNFQLAQINFFKYISILEIKLLIKKYETSKLKFLFCLYKCCYFSLVDSQLIICVYFYFRVTFCFSGYKFYRVLFLYHIKITKECVEQLTIANYYKSGNYCTHFIFT